MNKLNKFIFVIDENVADILKKNGFTLLSDSADGYTFINDGILKFENDEDKNILTKMAYTNKLCF